ncbi:MAG: ATP-binding protein [Myxococcales bacterium]|nr:ATP-binding protein [Myxococcales bacterium]
MAERRRRILRFFGPRGDLLAAEPPNVVIYDPAGNERIRAEIGDFLDVIAVDDQLWIASPGRLRRISARDGRELANEPLDYLAADGRFLQSATAPQLPVWHSREPAVIRIDPARLEIPGTGGELILPLVEGRWLLWQGGQLRLWRSIGEAWRKPVGEPGMRPGDAQVLLDGRLVAIAQQRVGDRETRITVAAISDGSPHAQLRIPAVDQLAFAARRGLLVARSGDRLSVIDLRFGRWIRDLALPAGVTEFAVDDGLQRIALASHQGIEIVGPDALAAPSPTDDGDPADTNSNAPSDGGEGADRPAGRGDARATETEPVPAPTSPVVVQVVGDIEVELELEGVLRVDPAPPPPPPPEPDPASDEPLPDAPLVRLDPVSVSPTATEAEAAQAVALGLDAIAARVHLAIAEAWDTGRLSKPDPTRPPFIDEVSGLMQLTSGRASAELREASMRLSAAERAVAVAARGRRGRLTTFDVLARDFQLSPLAVSILFTIAAPRMRGDLARLYGILANDPNRALVDELLLVHIFGATHAAAIAHELDGDQPLRRYGLVAVGPGERPFAPLLVDPLVVRTIADQPADRERDPYLKLRQVDRDLEELQVPRELLFTAVRYLASAREREPVRIVVRGRTGSGRHTLLTSLAARAGRSLGVIDLALVPRESGRLAHTLQTVLRRALLRGLVPCVDGLELVGAEDPDTKVQLAMVLRTHPGPIALRLPTEGQIPLDPGYLVLDVPPRNEILRGESWAIAFDQHQIDLPDGSELAARYRVGPGIIERVCAEVSRRPERPQDPAAWVKELDEAVRQHLENRLSATANRVTRLSTWADMVLPEDIIDSLLELTARVRHRKQVYERWGFDRSLTTARGITALFAGSPGTGKTMVAGVIARDLGLEMYRVDVSRIASKWIGETEKNLGNLFDAAEDGQVLLLFDEADSLFAKRTEVKSSVDRYANMEVNYLLQRLDSFEGIAILTTNFGTSIDPAFKRRLTYRVTFPFPDEEMREQLWRTMIPPQLPVHGTLDFAALSHRFRLSGGYIRNAVLRAAFLAAEEGTALTHEHLERAIRMEFREIGKLAETGTLE